MTQIKVERSDKGIRGVEYVNSPYDRASVEFGKDSVALSGYWDGNSGEWTPEWLGCNLDREAVVHLHQFLSSWLDQTRKQASDD